MSHWSRMESLIYILLFLHIGQTIHNYVLFNLLGSSKSKSCQFKCLRKQLKALATENALLLNYCNYNYSSQLSCLYNKGLQQQVSLYKKRTHWKTLSKTRDKESHKKSLKVIVIKDKLSNEKSQEVVAEAYNQNYHITERSTISCI